MSISKRHITSQNKSRITGDISYQEIRIEFLTLAVRVAR